MASAEAFEVIQSVLVPSWTATAIYFENDQQTLPDSVDYFVFVEVYGQLFEQASIGGGSPTENLWREEGAILAHVMCPRGDGSLKGRQYARQICDLFRGQDISGIRFREMSIGASEPGDEDGSYWRLTVTIDWQRDEP